MAIDPMLLVAMAIEGPHDNTFLTPEKMRELRTIRWNKLTEQEKTVRYVEARAAIDEWRNYTALYIALPESETKESLAVMVCDLREKLAVANKGWLDQAARDAAEIVRLEMIIKNREANVARLKSERRDLQDELDWKQSR